MARQTDKTDQQRIIDIRANLKRVKKGDRLSLEDCASIWGVSKPRFVNKRREFHEFPAPIVEGIQHFFDAREALKGMLGYLETHQQAIVEKAKSNAKLLGVKNLEEQLMRYSPQELVTLNRLQTELDQRAHDQGQFVAMSDVSAIAGAVFSELSEFLSRLSNILDPHGKLDPGLRELIDKNARKRLLEVHARLKRLLTDDADDRTSLPETGRPRLSRPRRKR